MDETRRGSTRSKASVAISWVAVIVAVIATLVSLATTVSSIALGVSNVLFLEAILALSISLTVPLVSVYVNRRNKQRRENDAISRRFVEKTALPLPSALSIYNEYVDLCSTAGKLRNTGLTCSAAAQYLAIQAMRLTNEGRSLDALSLLGAQQLVGEGKAAGRLRNLNLPLVVPLIGVVFAGLTFIVAVIKLLLGQPG
jgi:hypothetical protein